MKKAVTNLQNIASSKAVLLFFFLTMAVYFFMLLYTIPRVESFAPGIALFDLSPSGYSYQHAISLLEALGKTGRNTYLFQQLPTDFIYPGLFAISYTLLLFWLFGKSIKANSIMFYLAMVPILGGLFDYLENIFIILMIRSFPDLSQALVVMASTATILKSIFTSVFFLLLLVGVISFLITRLKQKPDVGND